MPRREDYPYLQTNVVREILFQYCEVRSKEESQWKFIEDLGVPSAWLNEALAIYYNYVGDLAKALHHFLECGNWQRAHSIFFTSVAHSLFLSDSDLQGGGGAATEQVDASTCVFVIMYQFAHPCILLTWWEANPHIADGKDGSNLAISRSFAGLLYPRSNFHHCRFDIYWNPYRFQVFVTTAALI